MTKLEIEFLTIHDPHGRAVNPSCVRDTKDGSALCHLAFASYGAGSWSCHVRLPEILWPTTGGMKDKPTVTASRLFIECFLIKCFTILIYIYNSHRLAYQSKSHKNKSPV